MEVRNNFADEAQEEFMELNNESDSDSDYDEYNQTDLEQFERDNFIDKKQKTEILYVDGIGLCNESETENLGHV